MWCLLNAAEEFTSWLAVVCTSFSSMNVGTSKRSPVTPWGDQDRPHVVLGNLLMSRTILLVFLVTALKGRWYIEQPASSAAQWYPRLEYMLSRIPVWVSQWWARHYGGLTPMLNGSYCFKLGIKDVVF